MTGALHPGRRGGTSKRSVTRVTDSQSGLAGAVRGPVEGTSPSHMTTHRPLRPASLERAEPDFQSFGCWARRAQGRATAAPGSPTHLEGFAVGASVRS